MNTNNRMSSGIATAQGNPYRHLRELARSASLGVSALASTTLSASAVTAPLASASSSTVSLSSAGLKLLQGLGRSVVDVAQGVLGVAAEAVELPFDVVKDVAAGVESATADAAKVIKDASSGSGAALAADASSFVHDVFVTLPANIGSDVLKDTKAGLADASMFASGVVGLTLWVPREVRPLSGLPRDCLYVTNYAVILIEGSMRISFVPNVLRDCRVRASAHTWAFGATHAHSQEGTSQDYSHRLAARRGAGC